MGYHEIIRESISLDYVDKESTRSFKGRIEELGEDSISSKEGGAVAREIILTTLDPLKDSTGAPLDMTLNNQIIYQGKTYIISTFSLEKPRKNAPVFNYRKYHCNLMQSEDSIIETDPIIATLKNFIKGSILSKCPFSSFEQFKIRSQEDYDSLPYPRLVWDVYKHSQEGTPSRYFKDNLRYVRYSNVFRVELEFYSDAKSNNSISKIEEFIQDEELLHMESLTYIENGILQISLKNFDISPDGSSFINNEPRKKTTRFIDLVVDYEVNSDYSKIDNLTVQGRLIPGAKNC